MDPLLVENDMIVNSNRNDTNQHSEKVALIRFLNSSGDYRVHYFQGKMEAAETIINFVNEHHCNVVIVSGFTADEINLLEKIPGITIKQKH